MTRIVNNEVCASKGCNKPNKKIIYFSLGFSANFCAECADDLTAKDLGIEVNKMDEMRNNWKNAKIIKSLQSAQAGGQGQIAAADYTPAGADEIRQ